LRFLLPEVFDPESISTIASEFRAAKGSETPRAELAKIMFDAQKETEIMVLRNVGK